MKGRRSRSVLARCHRYLWTKAISCKCCVQEIMWFPNVRIMNKLGKLIILVMKPALWSWLVKRFWIRWRTISKNIKVSRTNSCWTISQGYRMSTLLAIWTNFRKSSR